MSTLTKLRRRAGKGIPADSLKLLAKALGLTDDQLAITAALLVNTESWDTGRIARQFGVQPQAVRKWRRERNRALEAGETPATNALIRHAGKAGQSPQYVAWEVLLWGMQTERLLYDGKPNPDRQQPGRALGPIVPNPRTGGVDLTPQRDEVVREYRTNRRAGHDDQTARQRTAESLNLSRGVVGRRLLEAERDTDAYGPLWVETSYPLAKVS